MMRGLAPVVVLALCGLGGAAAQHSATPAPARQVMPPVAIMRPMVIHPAPVPVHIPAVHAAPIIHPIIVPRTNSAAVPLPAHPLSPAGPLSAPEPGLAPGTAPGLQNVPAATPTPNPLHFRRMAMPQTITLA